jgi:hypothetical protein
MKKNILILFLCILGYNTQAQTKVEPKTDVKIDPLEKTTKAVCDCLNKNKDKSGEELLQGCMAEGFMMNMGDMMEKYPEMMSGDEKASQKVMQDIAMKLMSDCPAFVAAASKSNLNPATSKQVTDQIQTTEGIFAKMETKNYTYLVLEVGVEKQKFVILESFEGEKAVLGQEKALKKKKLAVSWKERKIFMAKTNTYETVKQITGVK